MILDARLKSPIGDPNHSDPTQVRSTNKNTPERTETHFNTSTTLSPNFAQQTNAKEPEATIQHRPTTKIRPLTTDITTR